jgi:hypothetical protein
LEVEGVVASADDNAWTLQVLRVDHRDGKSIPWNREAVRFPRTALTNTTVKKFDKKRSWMMAGLVTAGAYLAARIFNVIGADEDPGTDPTPAESIVPGRGRGK